VWICNINIWSSLREWLMRRGLPAIFVLLFFSIFTDTAFADNRVALVIGNGAYAHVPHLPNPSHDAQDVAAALKRTGFQTIVGIDLDQAGMQDAAIRFARAARTADVAMFYYSGHALQFAGVNYMVPIDAQLHDEADLRRMTRVDEVVADLQQAKNLRILVLDSCRNNPLADELKRSVGTTRSVSIGRGLAKIDSPEGMIVAYATQAGRTAEDGAGRNSPYTAAFLRNVEAKEEIGTIFRRISADVYQTTRQTQLPELSLSLIGEFYLNGKLQITVAPATPPAPADPCVAASDHWRSAEAINTRGAFEDHLARFPNCAFAGLARARIETLNKVAVAPTPAASSQAPTDTGHPGILGGLLGSLIGKSSTSDAPLPPASPPPTQQALVAPPIVPSVSSGPCDNGSLTVSLLSRSACPLSARTERALKPKDIFKECDGCPEMVVVPAGTFTMGAPPIEEGFENSAPSYNEGPAHRVTISRQFAVGKFAVTFAEWDACVAAGGCNGYRPSDEQWGRDRQPVIRVSWDDAKAYVAWLSRKTGKPYRLLSEAEREYVARADTTSPYWWGSAILTRQANFDSRGYAAAGGGYRGKPMPVDAFAPNPWDLYQVHGNVWEWVEDCYNESYDEAPSDGSAWTSGDCSRRVLRGGSWGDQRDRLRAAARNKNEYRINLIGFRIARTLAP
jgi:formylglycine-generating enzyme required for sulfatase activity